MTEAEQLALTVGPLAFYLYLLALWQGGRGPKVIAGTVDFGWLVVGLAGPIAFGPIGSTLAAGLMGGTGFLARLGLLALGVPLLVPAWWRARRRLVVYNVRPEGLRPALALALEDRGGGFQETLRGFEDPTSARGFHVEVAPRMRSGVVEAYGPEADRVAADLRAILWVRLQAQAEGPSRMAWVLLGLSCATLLGPTLGWLLARTEALRALGG